MAIYNASSTRFARALANGKASRRSPAGKVAASARAGSGSIRLPAADLSFRDWYVRSIPPHWDGGPMGGPMPPHIEYLIGMAQKVVDGDVRRLAVSLPPGHGKSATLTQRLPLYWSERNGGTVSLLTGYNSSFAANELSAPARDVAEEMGTLGPGSSARDSWRLRNGSRVISRGVGVAPTGINPIKFLVIDDPIRSRADAESETLRDKIWSWWTGSIVQRFFPETRVLIVATRWHHDDLIGRLQHRDNPKNGGPGDWTFVNIPAIAGDDDPLGREEGEALWPEKKPRAFLDGLRRETTEYEFSALFQGQPTPTSGAYWKRAYFPKSQTFTTPPPNLYARGYDWDTAYSKNEKNSASAYVETARDRLGNIFVLDAGFRWLDTPAAEAWMEQLGGPHYVEAKASGKSIVQTLTNRGITAVEVQVNGGGDKEARTSMVTPDAAAGRIFVAEHILPVLLDDEKQGILRFPAGSHDDLNDALVQAINRHRDATAARVLMPGSGIQ